MKMNLKTLFFALSTIFSFSQEKVLKMASESIDAEELRAVSYTHLTLPTKVEV